MITDDTGAVAARLKYDPFGARVQPGRLDLPVTGSPLGERVGFTGHEHDDGLGLINMEGRLYDPKLGHFLTPDPLVGDPYATNAYNRYAYVSNNPASLTDPTGFDSQPDQPDSSSSNASFGSDQSTSNFLQAVLGPLYNLGELIFGGGTSPQSSAPPQGTQTYNPREWDVIQLELIPDAPAPMYPNVLQTQAYLDNARKQKLSQIRDGFGAKTGGGDSSILSSATPGRMAYVKTHTIDYANFSLGIGIGHLLRA